MVASFIAPHPPLIPPEFYFNRYLRTCVPDPHIGDWAMPPPNGGIGGGPSGFKVDLQGEALLSARAGYYGLINHLDDQIRRLLSNLTCGLDLNNTIVVYTSDHGEMLGDHYMWKKSMPYEGSAHVPFMARLPKRFEGPIGQVLDYPVCLEDILPTLCDLAEIEIPDTVDGSSLAGILRGEPPPESRTLHLQCAHQAHPLKHHTLTDGKEKFIWNTVDGMEQFFRLTDDPHELHDLSERPEEADRVSYWRSELIKKLADAPEGFTDGKRLIPGRPFPAVRPSRR
jgi:arylsulfatase A-like enzyme